MDYHLSLRKVEAAGIEVEVVAMPLSMARPGDRVQVGESRGRGLAGQLRLEGLTPGSALEVVQELGNSGGMVVRAGDREMRLGRGQAQRLMVRPLPE
jgi:Fe2+ transport system protein FeoA